MRDFVRKAIGFALLQVALAVLVVSLYRIDRNAYAASFIDKQNRLESTPGRRLLLVGGSNVSFSTNSELLERRLGLAPVDLGIQHSFGLGFMLEQARRGMRRGDVIVLSLEFGQYQERTEEPLSLLSVVEQDRRALRAIELDWPLFKAMCDRSHLYFRGVLRSAINGRFFGGAGAAPPYTRDSFNVYGDVVGHWTLRSPGFSVSGKGADEPDPDILAKLNAFVDVCEKQGVSVFLFHPAVPRAKFENSMVEHLERTLETRLRIRRLNRAAEMVYPDSLFYDSAYHTTREGTVRRTELLAERLERALR
jgi:hypothetical protein